MSVIRASWKPVRLNTARAAWSSAPRVRSDRFVRIGRRAAATGGAMTSSGCARPTDDPPRPSPSAPPMGRAGQRPYVSDPDVAINLAGSFRAGAAGSAKVGVRRGVPVTEPTTMTSVAADVGDWLASNWDPERSLAEWREILVDSGWGCPAWPQEWYGRGLPDAAKEVVDAEFRKVGAVGTAGGSGMGLAAVTILEHGSDDLKRRLLRPTATGEYTWCQLFSEPGSGSDLAGLTTHAVLDGDEWVINGQKVWNTSAHHAEYGMLLARTDWSVPKHRGITYFVIKMHQPGVHVRPLRQMNGYASFNEVFLDDARVPVADVVGTVNEGWRAALTTLSHERGLAAHRPARHDTSAGRVLQEAQVEWEIANEPYKWYPQRAGRPDLVVDRTRAEGRAADPLVPLGIHGVQSLGGGC